MNQLLPECECAKGAHDVKACEKCWCHWCPPPRPVAKCVCSGVCGE